MTDDESKFPSCLERNRTAFQDDLERLLAAHEGKYALMHDALVVSIFDSMRNAHVFGRGALVFNRSTSATSFVSRTWCTCRG